MHSDDMVNWLIRILTSAMGDEYSPILELQRFNLDLHAKGEAYGIAANVLIKGLPTLIGQDISARVGLGNTDQATDVNDFNVFIRFNNNGTYKVQNAAEDNLTATLPYSPFDNFEIHYQRETTLKVFQNGMLLNDNDHTGDEDLSVQKCVLIKPSFSFSLTSLIHDYLKLPNKSNLTQNL